MIVINNVTKNLLFSEVYVINKQSLIIDDHQNNLRLPEKDKT